MGTQIHQLLAIFKLNGTFLRCSIYFYPFFGPDMQESPYKPYILGIPRPHPIFFPFLPNFQKIWFDWNLPVSRCAAISTAYNVCNLIYNHFKKHEGLPHPIFCHQSQSGPISATARWSCNCENILFIGVICYALVGKRSKKRPINFPRPDFKLVLARPRSVQGYYEKYILAEYFFKKWKFCEINLP
jgi:hypothetical protein